MKADDPNLHIFVQSRRSWVKADDLFYKFYRWKQTILSYIFGYESRRFTIKLCERYFCVLKPNWTAFWIKNDVGRYFEPSGRSKILIDESRQFGNVQFYDKKLWSWWSKNFKTWKWTVELSVNRHPGFYCTNPFPCPKCSLTPTLVIVYFYLKNQTNLSPQSFGPIG